MAKQWQVHFEHVAIPLPPEHEYAYRQAWQILLRRVEEAINRERANQDMTLDALSQNGICDP